MKAITLRNRPGRRSAAGAAAAALAGLIVQAVAAEPAGGFKLSSPAFADGDPLPRKFTCQGDSVSPPLQWTDGPAGTASYAVTVEHVAGPDDRRVHLLLYDLPADARSLAENARGVGRFGVNTVSGDAEYAAPCARGATKQLTITLYALSAVPKPQAGGGGVTIDAFLKAVRTTTLGTAKLTVSLSRGRGDGRDDGGHDDGPPRKG